MSGAGAAVARAEGDGSAALPVALAAVSVDGRCRERNPPDLAIFGAERDRLVQRFCDQGEGQALLARCTESGTAEGVARLDTAAGPRLFRVSLWRQRGGERIRILAAFAAIDVGDCPCAAGHAQPLEGARAGTRAPWPPSRRRLAEAGLAGPVETIIALADRLRLGTDLGEDWRRRAEAETLLAAAWRLRRVCDDLAALDHGAPLATGGGEVEVLRLLERLRAAVAPSAEAASVALLCMAPGEGESRAALVADEARLWTLLEILLRGRLALADEGETLRLRAAVRDPAEGLALELLHEPAPADERARDRARGEGHDTDLAFALAEACGALLAIDPGAREGWRAEIRFPARRCVTLPPAEGTP